MAIYSDFDNNVARDVTQRELERQNGTTFEAELDKAIERIGKVVEQNRQVLNGQEASR